MTPRTVKRTGAQDDRRQQRTFVIHLDHLLGVEFAFLIRVERVARMRFVNDVSLRQADDGDRGDVNESAHLISRGGFENIRRALHVHLLKIIFVAPKAEERRGMNHVIATLHHPA